ncbi:MAG: amino acid-binding protein [Novosphingobium sp.]|nr:amino acid-binding protein [Novosphingobium sp.]
MTSRIILTVLGSDRPGLTQAIATAVTGADGNWLESRLGRLGGQYVGSVLVELPAENVARLENAVRAIDAEGLHVSLIPAGADPGRGTELAFELVGQDRPGIVREVTAVLAGLGVNIEDLDTGIENGAWSGERLFRAKARVTLPGDIGADAVRDALETISGEVMVDFTFAA